MAPRPQLELWILEGLRSHLFDGVLPTCGGCVSGQDTLHGELVLGALGGSTLNVVVRECRGRERQRTKSDGGREGEQKAGGDRA